MTFFKKILVGSGLLVLVSAAGFTLWANTDISSADTPVEFSIKPGSGLNSAMQQIAEAGVPVQPTLLALLARLVGQGQKIKAGNYELKPGTTPHMLIVQLARGEFAQESLVIIEGWTFKQMRRAIADHPALKHDTADMTEQELLAIIAPDYKQAEGLFFPDTYLFAKGASDLQIFKQANTTMTARLNDAWAVRDAALPYKNPYEALVMASIVEKETGKQADRDMIAGVFVNRLKTGMMLQTDPTVIYGMGDSYQGNIRKRDLLADTPYNTYKRTGLPPTPIALPGAASLAAALNPAKTDALYFVAKGDGGSQFSSNLSDHNQAVNKYQRGAN